MQASAIAVDLGASSGRVARGTIRGSRVDLEELHRFATPSRSVGDALQWDLDALEAQIIRGLRAAHGGPAPVSVGIDTWGVDYGLLDAAGELIAAPFHHRDRRTAGRSAGLDRSFLFERTGVLSHDINTLTQLLSEEDAVLRRARTLLFMPDLLAHRLSGEAATDPTIASTSQLVSTDGVIDREVFSRHGLPDILPPILPSGTILGRALPTIAAGTGFDGHVITIAGHDTAAAVAAIPTEETPVAFISCGTWALVGLDLDRPVVTPEARDAGFTNEIGYRSHHLLRNASGLWLLNECIREWGATASDAPLIAHAASAAEPFRSIIDPMDPLFLAPGRMPRRIESYCADRGQPTPRSTAEFARCIFDSLALEFASSIHEASRLAGVQTNVTHIVGGGSRISLLCATTADLIGRPVVAGPAEATMYGNMLIQARALDLLTSPIREVMMSSVSTTTYVPAESAESASALRAYHDLVALREPTS